jgi:hypothetical protein
VSRGRFFVHPFKHGDVPTIVDARTGDVHRRPHYTLGEAELVVAWLNRADVPLKMVAPIDDPWMVRWERRVGVKYLLE